MMSTLTETIEQAEKIVILGHVNPDADCVGACMAMYNYIKDVYPEKEAQVYLQKVPEKLTYIPGIETVSSNAGTGMIYDLCICLDASDRARLGDFVLYLDHAISSICVDHHITNPGYCQWNEIKGNVSSTCEFLFGFLDYDLISRDTATCLYTGIVGDTNLFKNLNTTPQTMYVAGELMEKGIDFNYIINTSYYRRTYVQNQILGRAFLESILLLDGKCIFSVIRKKNMDFYGVKDSDLEGIVDQLKSTAGVEVAIFMYEVENQCYKVSLRSSDRLDVAKIASYFGGGGHKCAAGCSMSGNIHDAVNNLTLHIEKQLNGEESVSKPTEDDESFDDEI